MPNQRSPSAVANVDLATRELLKGRPARMRQIIWPGATGTRRQRKAAVNVRLREMRHELSGVEPSKDELALLTQLGRVVRAVDEGASVSEATESLLRNESAPDYVQRNQEAMQLLEERILSPEYMARFAAIQAEPDPVKRAKMSADLKRKNFAAIDMEAVHRTIRARNIQWKKEGILPPDVKI
jgi:hypothetical protein